MKAIAYSERLTGFAPRGEDGREPVEYANMAYHGIDIPQGRLAEICRRYGVQRLSLFGSILTERFTPESDVDMLVEFLPGTRIGFFGVTRMEMELSDMIGRKVDLRTPQDLSKYFRDQVVREAQLQYAA